MSSCLPRMKNRARSSASFFASAFDVGEGALFGKGAPVDGVATMISLWGEVKAGPKGERWSMALFRDSLNAPYGMFQFRKLR